MKKSIEQQAVDFAGDRSLGAGHGYPSHTANLLKKGYLEGYKVAQREFEKILNKVSLSNEDITSFGDGFEYAIKLINKKLK